MQIKYTKKNELYLLPSLVVYFGKAQARYIELIFLIFKIKFNFKKSKNVK